MSTLFTRLPLDTNGRFVQVLAASATTPITAVCGTRIDATGAAVLSDASSTQALQSDAGTQLQSDAPNAASGPVMKISKTETYATSTVCNSNQVDSQCNAALVVVSQGLGANIEQTTAIVGAAYSSSSAGSSNADIGGVFTGEATAGVTTGQGVYIQGRRDVATANAQSGEIRVQNNTSTDCTVSYTGIGSCDGLWMTAQSDGTNATGTSSAVHVGKTGSNINGYHEGVTLNNGAVVDTGFNDQSSSVAAFKAGGTHTYALQAVSGVVQLQLLTVATLPTCNGTTTHSMASVSDATAPTYNATLTGGGAVQIPVYCNGTAWTAH